MENRNIYERLLEIQQNISVAKNRFNEFGNFNYRSAEDIINELKPFLKEHKLLLLFNDKINVVGERYYIESTAILTDGTNSITASAVAREPQTPKAKMDESQASGSTSSYARKYALNALLALDDNVDSDDINDGKKRDNSGKEIKLITKVQIAELKKLGFDDGRLEKMAKYYKVDEISQVSFKQADEAIKKQKRSIEKAGVKNE